MNSKLYILWSLFFGLLGTHGHYKEFALYRGNYSDKFVHRWGIQR